MAYREERGFKKENEEEDAFPAMGDAVIAAAPDCVSARESLEKNRDYWDPARGAIDTPTKGTPQGIVYQQPASNLPAGPISIAKLRGRSAGWPSI